MTDLRQNLEQERRRLLMERSVQGRMGVTLPPLDVPLQELPPREMLREELELPEVSEGEAVRYFTNLSRLNFSIDTNFYSLGCLPPSGEDDLVHATPVVGKVVVVP